MTIHRAVHVACMVAIGTGCGGSPSSSEAAGTPTTKPPLPGAVEFRVADTNRYDSGWQLVAGPGSSVWYSTVKYQANVGRFVP